MSTPFWRQSSLWWVPIVVILISGMGWYVGEQIAKSSMSGIIIGQLEDCPGEVQILIDGNETTTTSNFCWYQIDDVAPGEHEVQWQFEGYQTKYAMVSIKGGIQNRVDLTKLDRKVEPTNNGLPRVREELEVDRNIHTWYAGTKYRGTIDMKYEFGFIWDCSGGTCILEGPYGKGLNMSVCQALSRRVGELEYYYNDAGMSWTKTENSSLLDQCNSVTSNRLKATKLVDKKGIEDGNTTNSILAELARPVSKCLARKDTEHPIFNGCVDWHSSVHAIWSLIRYKRVTGSHKYDLIITDKLDANKVNEEFRMLKSKPYFEMPYGRAWFLRLVIDYEHVFGTNLLQPMGDYVAKTIIQYYKGNSPDPYAKTYSNPSWALLNLYQYGTHRKRDDWIKFVQNVVRKEYIDTKNKCLDDVGRSSEGFMDVCGNWAYLVAITDVVQNYRNWLKAFYEDIDTISPIDDAKNNHEKGLNFSRAWSYWHIYKHSGENRYIELYKKHIGEQLRNETWWKGADYSVTHWVAQFGIYAITPQYN